MRTEKPKSLKRKLSLAAVMGLMTVGVATPALATVAYVGGGTWTYGVTNSTNFSYYEHNGVWHGSSVRNSHGLVRSPCTRPGWMSYAEQAKSLSGNQAYWRHC